LPPKLKNSSDRFMGYVLSVTVTRHRHPGGWPNKHMLRMLKAVASRAGMDPDAWWLHKFRATFATHALQGGIDLRTVQSWMGHTDLASTMRYLRPARGEKVQAQVEALWA
jgi:integrase/recombinase XerD